MNQVNEYLNKCAISEGHFDLAFALAEKTLGTELAIHLWLKYSENLFVRYLAKKGISNDS